MARRPAAAGDRGRAGALRRDDRLCAFQPAGREALPRRRRQPADRPAARLAACCSLAGTAIWPRRSLLPLYYLADATITLLRRIVRREPVWQAHRTHFYQRATDQRPHRHSDRAARFCRQSAARGAGPRNGAAAEPWSSISARCLRRRLVAWLLMSFARGRRS